MSATVLIVDDNHDLHTILTAALKRVGYGVKSFFEGKPKEICELAASCDVLLLDIDLPGEDGVHISQDVKKMPSCAHVPIILISGNADVNKLCLQSKADACLLKPFSTNDLLEKISSLTQAA